MTVFYYSALVEENWKANLSEMNPYAPKYTFYSDFAIAEFCEVYLKEKDAVKKTFNSVLRDWGNDIEAMTEVYLVLNHKIWAFHDKVDSKYLGCGDAWAERFATLYNDLWSKCGEKIFKTFEKDDAAMSYFYRVTD